MTPNLLLVDDEAATRVSFSLYLKGAGFSLKDASNLAEARHALSQERFDAVLLDLNLPDGNGLDWILELKDSQMDMAIVVITGAGDVPLAVEAMRRGADHFLTKPVNMTDLEVFLRKSVEVGALRRRNTAQTRLAKKEQPHLGDSRTMQKVLPLLQVAAEKDSTVLLQGETGTGKGVYARWIYQRGARASMPFVEVNCSSLRGELLASELFGHVRGAFTSAVETKQGLLDVADGATLFLDEIGDMDIAVQSQFLKVLEEKRYRRLGDVQERRSEFRLLCATNRNLLEDVRDGRFRKDLYFRINIFPIELPPLRERLEDLPSLAQALLDKLGAPDVVISAETMWLFRNYPWPGNIRELRNVLERALLLARGKTLLPNHFPGLDAHRVLISGAPKYVSESASLHALLAEHAGDKKKTAKALGISLATLYRKLKSTK